VKILLAAATLLGRLCIASAEPGDDHLVAGQGLMKQGRFSAAAEELTLALKSAPDDAVVLSELADALCKAEDYARGEEIARRAIASPSLPAPLRAAGQYNLGCILEGTGRLDAAVEAYRASLSIRESKAARARLQAVARADRKPAEAVAPAALAGPFASRELACAAIRKDAGSDGDAACSWPAAPPVSSGPFQSIGAARIDVAENAHFYLVLRVGRGDWYFQKLAESENLYGRSTQQTPADALTWQATAGDRHDLLLTVDVQRRGGREVRDERDRKLLVCALDQAKRPACTASIPLVEDSGKRQVLRFDYRGGALRLWAAPGSPTADQQELIGKHLLRF
jgi:tetratricopeptide (TPR) repeat protein